MMFTTVEKATELSFLEEKMLAGIIVGTPSFISNPGYMMMEKTVCSGRLWSAVYVSLVGVLVGPGRPWSALVGPSRNPTNGTGKWSGRPWSLLVGPGRPWSAFVPDREAKDESHTLI